MYLDSKSDLINGALEDFFYEGDDGGAWDEAPPPNGLRDAPLELISALVSPYIISHPGNIGRNLLCSCALCAVVVLGLSSGQPSFVFYLSVKVSME